jgi:hypothetical protein
MIPSQNGNGYGAVCAGLPLRLLPMNLAGRFSRKAVDALRENLPRPPPGAACGIQDRAAARKSFPGSPSKAGENPFKMVEAGD